MLFRSNLHPVSVMFTVLVMGLLFGLLGAVLAVPVCAIGKICWEEFYLAPRATDTLALQTLADEIIKSNAPAPRNRRVRRIRPPADPASSTAVEDSVTSEATPDSPRADS